MEQLLSDALRQDLPLPMSAVNWGEVFYTEWRYYGEAACARQKNDCGIRRSQLSLPIVNAPPGLAL